MLGLQAIARLMRAFAFAGRLWQRALDDPEPPTCLQTFHMELVYA
jgi:hypothetical protein